MVCAWYLSPLLRTTEEGEGKRKRSQFLAAGMAGLRQWGRAAVPPPSEAAARRAAWWQEREQKRSAGQKNGVSSIIGMHIRQRLGGWQAGLVLGEKQGQEKGRKGKRRKRGRNMKVRSRLVSRPRPRPRTAAHLPVANRH